MTLHKQRGVVLVTCMIILFVITILALYMFGGFTQDEKISGNTREKARAVDASFSALNQAQFWMAQSGNVYDNGWKTGVSCTASSTTPVVCSNEISAPTTLPWTVGVTGTIPGLNVVDEDDEGSRAGKYAEGTRYHIQYIETVGANPGVGMYRVTATATGGNADAVAVQQGVFQVTTDSQDIGGG
jgi:type IV pilus assembly protein PilX